MNLMSTTPIFSSPSQMKLGAFRMLDNDDEGEPSDGIKAGTLFASKDKPATPVPLSGKGGG